VEFVPDLLTPHVHHIGQVAQADGARNSVQRASYVMTVLLHVSHISRYAVVEDM
jgi:hypothetical protein